MSAFFVKGAESSKNPEAYCATVQHIPERERAKFLHGERRHKNTEKAKRFMTVDLPITNIAEMYVIFIPLSRVKPGESPVVVVFCCRHTADHRPCHAGRGSPCGH